MKTASLSGSPREGVGKKDAAELRAKGQVPGVLYGGSEQVHFHVNEVQLNKLIFTPDTFRFQFEVGGTTVHWSGCCLRLRPEELRARSLYGEVPGTSLIDWPFGYDELEGWYSQAEHFLGVSGDVADQAYLGIEFKDGYQYPMKTIPLTWLNGKTDPF